MAFLCGISLLPEKKALFFSILQKQSSRGVLWPATLLKKRLWRRCFPVNFVKFLRTPFLTEHLQWLLLYGQDYGEYFICSYEFFGRFRVEDAGWQMQDGGYYIFQIELGINNQM